MPVELLGALVSSIIGGLLVAIVNYVFARRKTEAETEKLKAEAEKTRAETAKLIVELKKLSATVEEANYLTKSALKEQIIYDSSQGTDVFDFSGCGTYILGEDPNSLGQGGFTIKQDVIAIERTNLVGSYGVALNRYSYDGKVREFISKNEVLSGRRKFRVSFEAKATKGSSVIRVEFKEHSKNYNGTLETQDYSIAQDEWLEVHLLFKIISSADCVVWIWVVNPSEQNTTLLRNIQIAERLG